MAVVVGVGGMDESDVISEIKRIELMGVVGGAGTKAEGRVDDIWLLR
jgi:glutamate/tyrosine decarboxylase-like PLP-dependent enzyme